MSLGVLEGRPGKPLVTVGRNIHTRRRALRMTMAQLALLAGVNPRTITRICQGDLGVRLSTLSALAGVLQCEAWELLRPEGL